MALQGPGFHLSADALPAWCYRRLVNVCHAEWRKRKRALGDLQTPLPTVEPRAPDDTSPMADRDLLERGFARLSMEHRIVVVLCYYGDMPVPEIARTLGIREGTAKSRLYHAMRGLRAALDADARASDRVGEVICWTSIRAPKTWSAPGSMTDRPSFPSRS